LREETSAGAVVATASANVDYDNGIHFNVNLAPV
jgi:hypothetical protein